MSISTVSIIMGRVEVATPWSAIAVFDVGSDEMANAVFAATAKTKQLIDVRPPDLIGVFDKTMSASVVRNAIQKRLDANQKVNK